MKLMVMAPAVFPSEQEARHKLRFFLRSCERFGIEPNLFGMGTTSFPGYAALNISLPLAYLEKHASEYDTVLATDSWDVLFTGSLAEIQFKYECMGQPPFLASAFYQLGNVSDEQKQYPGVFKHDTYYKFPNVGGYIAEISLAIELLTRMKKEYPQYNDGAFCWYDAIRDGWFHPVLDSNCDIFQVRSEENTEVGNEMKIMGPDGAIIQRWQHPRIRNNITNSFPCIWHLSGGYASHETGKDETMIPFAKMLELGDPE